MSEPLAPSATLHKSLLLLQQATDTITRIHHAERREPADTQRLAAAEAQQRHHLQALHVWADSLCKAAQADADESNRNLHAKDATGTPADCR